MYFTTVCFKDLIPSFGKNISNHSLSHDLFQENVPTLQHQPIRAPTFCKLRRHDGYGSCRQLQIQGKCICNTHRVHCCWQHLRIKTNRLRYAKRRSLQPDTGLPTLGRSLLHIKAFHCFLFVHSQLEAQSISIPPYSQSVNEEQSAIHTFNGSLHPLLRPIWPQILLLAHTWKREVHNKGRVL